MKTAFIVLKNADSCEGRGPMVFGAVCSDYVTAEKVAFSMEPYRHKNQFTEIREVTLIESFDGYKADLDRIAKEKALAKLTTEEKRLLGLDNR